MSNVDAVLILLFLTGPIVAGGVYSAILRQRRGDKLMSFSVCEYLGGGPRWFSTTTMLDVTIYERAVALNRTLMIQLRQREIPLVHIKEVRHLGRPPASGIDGVEYVRNIDSQLEAAAAQNLTWVYALLTWENGTCLLSFPSREKAESFVSALQEMTGGPA